MLGAPNVRGQRCSQRSTDVGFTIRVCFTTLCEVQWLLATILRSAIFELAAEAAFVDRILMATSSPASGGKNRQRLVVAALLSILFLGVGLATATSAFSSEKPKQVDSALKTPEPGFKVRGAWAPSTAYLANDVISHEGATWVVREAFSSGATFSPDKLTIWAARRSYRRYRGHGTYRISGHSRTFWIDGCHRRQG